MDKWEKHAKKSAHDEFDRLWKEGYMNREEAYTWLAKKMGISGKKCHMARLNESQCFDVERIVTKKLKQARREYEYY